MGRIFTTEDIKGAEFQPTAEEKVILKSFWLQVGDTVEHVGDVGEYGKVVYIDANLISGYGVTTCLVQWDGLSENELDIQWTNKLKKLSFVFTAVNLKSNGAMRTASSAGKSIPTVLGMSCWRGNSND